MSEGKKKVYRIVEVDRRSRRSRCCVMSSLSVEKVESPRLCRQVTGRVDKAK